MISQQKALGVVIKSFLEKEKTSRLPDRICWIRVRWLMPENILSISRGGTDILQGSYPG